MLIRSIAWERAWLQVFLSEEGFEELRNWLSEVWSQVCLVRICIWMVLIEAVYLEKLCGVICPGSAWILYALMKENKLWEMLVICNFHTSAVCGRGSLRAQGGFTVFMNQKSRTICSVLKNVFFFPVPSLLPHLLQAFLSTGYCNMFWIFEHCWLGGIRGCLCFARCQIVFQCRLLCWELNAE